MQYPLVGFERKCLQKITIINCVELFSGAIGKFAVVQKLWPKNNVFFCLIFRSFLLSWLNLQLLIGESCKFPDMLEFMDALKELCYHLFLNHCVNHVLTLQSYPSQTILNGRIMENTVNRCKFEFWNDWWYKILRITYKKAKFVIVCNQINPKHH